MARNAIRSAEGIARMRLSALSLLSALKSGIVSVFLVAGALSLVLAAGCSASSPSNSTTSSPSPSVAISTPVLTATASPVPSPSRAVTSTPAPTPAPSPEEFRTFVGSSAPDFSFKLFQGEETLGGSELSLSDVAGQPIILNFWARFCGPCWSEMPELQDFYEEQQGRLRLLGVDVGQFTGLGSPKDAGKLLDALGITYPAGYTDDAEVVSNYRIRAMPTTVFIDSKGVVFQTWTGAINRRQLEAIVDDMLAEE